MKAKDILDLSNFKCHTDEATLLNEFEGAYASDLLSMVVSKAKEDNCFITVQCNMNSIAVAVMTDLRVIIFVHGFEPNKEMIEKANSENICLLSTSLDTCSVILLLKENNLL